MPVHLPDTVDAAVAQLAEDRDRHRVGRRHRPDGRGERRPSSARPAPSWSSTGSPSSGRGDATPPSRRSRSVRQSATGSWRPDRSPSCSRRSPRRRGRSVRRRSATPARSAATSGPARRPATDFPVLAALDAVVELARTGRSANDAGHRLHGRREAHGAGAGRDDRVDHAAARRRLAGIRQGRVSATRW